MSRAGGGQRARAPWKRSEAKRGTVEAKGGEEGEGARKQGGGGEGHAASATTGGGKRGEACLQAPRAPEASLRTSPSRGGGTSRRSPPAADLRLVSLIFPRASLPKGCRDQPVLLRASATSPGGKARSEEKGPAAERPIRSPPPLGPAGREAVGARGPGRGPLAPARSRQGSGPGPLPEQRRRLRRGGTAVLPRQRRQRRQRQWQCQGQRGRQQGRQRQQ